MKSLSPERVIALTNSSSRLSFREAVADDPQKRQPDITLASTKLDWHPNVALDEGLRQTISYFAGHL